MINLYFLSNNLFLCSKWWLYWFFGYRSTVDVMLLLPYAGLQLRDSSMKESIASNYYLSFTTLLEFRRWRVIVDIMHLHLQALSNWLRRIVSRSIMKTGVCVTRTTCLSIGKRLRVLLHQEFATMVSYVSCQAHQFRNRMKAIAISWWRLEKKHLP